MPATLILYTLDLAAGTALFGWNLAELNAPQSAIQDNLGLYAAQFGLASSVLAIGGLVGSVLAAPAMNAFGRKKILISSASVFGLAGICKASAGGAAALTVGRFLGGMAAGTAAVIVPIYINELAPPNYKGAFGALTQISINLGILSSQVLGVFLEQDDQWRIILLAGGLIGLLQAVGLMFIPESPSFLVAMGDIEQARRALIKIRGTEDVEQELAGFQAQQAGQPEGTDGTEPVGESDPLLEHPNGKIDSFSPSFNPSDV
ncbi:transporter-domain-containing protein [Tuber indicum]|nr:transporter-domain-containing protein [Tuber indicum]